MALCFVDRARLRCDGPQQFAAMRIACLQFAPHVGDVVDNLSAADDVLDKLDPTDLDGLDLLVLPELAFTGASPA